MKPIRDVPDADYLFWGSETHPTEVTKGQLNKSFQLISIE